MVLKWPLLLICVRGPAWTQHKNETFSFGWILQRAGGKHPIPDHSCKVSLRCSSDSLTRPLRLFIHTYNGRLCSHKVVFFFHFTIVLSDSKKHPTGNFHRLVDDSESAPQFCRERGNRGETKTWGPNQKSSSLFFWTHLLRDSGTSMGSATRFQCQCRSPHRWGCTGLCCPTWACPRPPPSPSSPDPHRKESVPPVLD